jgi:hypothetical protein
LLEDQKTAYEQQKLEDERRLEEEK